MRGNRGFFVGIVAVLSLSWTTFGCKARYFGQSESLADVESLVDKNNNFLGLQDSPENDGTVMFVKCMYNRAAKKAEQCENALIHKKDDKPAKLYAFDIRKSELKQYLEDSSFKKAIFFYGGGAVLTVSAAAFAVPGLRALWGMGVTQHMKDAPAAKVMAAIGLAGAALVAGIMVIADQKQWTWGNEARVLADDQKFTALVKKDVQNPEAPEEVPSIAALLPTLAQGLDLRVNPKVL